MCSRDLCLPTVRACMKFAQCVRATCTMCACSVHNACVQCAQCVRAVSSILRVLEDSSGFLNPSLKAFPISLHFEVV